MPRKLIAHAASVGRGASLPFLDATDNQTQERNRHDGGRTRGRSRRGPEKFLASTRRKTPIIAGLTDECARDELKP